MEKTPFTERDKKAIQGADEMLNTSEIRAAEIRSAKGP
jgi:hypothetical protein